MESRIELTAIKNNDVPILLNLEMKTFKTSGIKSQGCSMNYLIINTLEQENNADNIGLIILTPPKNSKYLYKLVENGVDNKIKLY